MPSHTGYQKVEAASPTVGATPTVPAVSTTAHPYVYTSIPVDEDRENSGPNQYSDTRSSQPLYIDNTMAPPDRVLPSTNSSQCLMGATDGSSVATSSSSQDEEKMTAAPSQDLRGFRITPMEWFTVLVLCFVNLINYMDRFTIAGVLPDIQATFQRDNGDGGLLQTVFVISYMICAPIFGYLGDRYSRRGIMIFGVAIWSATTLLGSFMQNWGWFMTFRALVGVGEASYSTIAPTIISDLFTHNIRSRMLAAFYFAIPVGSGLGYMIGSETAKAMGDWRYALRVTPILGLIAVVLIYFAKEPERGENEGSSHLQATSYKEDLKDICRNKSFMLSTLGFTCVAFVAGGLAWWGPTFMHLGMKLQPGQSDIELSRVSLIFGGITLLSGIIGVPLGSILSQRLKKRYPRCDPIICGTGLILSCPLTLGAMIVISKNSYAAFLLMFLGVLVLNLNWAIVGDILLYVVVPTRRSTAEAFQILISHMLGDAGSPYLVGLMSQWFRSEHSATVADSSYIKPGLQIYSQVAENSTLTTMTTTTTSTTMATILNHDQFSYPQTVDEFTSLQYALFIMCFVELLGAVFFFMNSYYVVQDKLTVDRAIQGCQLELTESSSNSMIQNDERTEKPFHSS